MLCCTLFYCAVLQYNALCYIVLYPAALQCPVGVSQPHPFPLCGGSMAEPAGTTGGGGEGRCMVVEGERGRGRCGGRGEGRIGGRRIGSFKES